MFKLEIHDVDIVVMRRIILIHADNLEQAQAKVEANDHLYARIDEKAYRFFGYAQQLGSYAKEGGKENE